MELEKFWTDKHTQIQVYRYIHGWKISMYIMAGITLLSTILILIFVPESPTWLLLKNRKDEAIKSHKPEY